MSKEYVMQLEATIENLRRDNKILKEELSKYKAIDNAKPNEALECSLKLYKMVESAGNGNGFNLNEAWKCYNTIKQALITKSKKELAFDEFNKYITSLHRRRNRYKKQVLYDFEDEKAAIRASTIEELYSKFKEVMKDE